MQKKRLASILLTIVLVMTLLPAGVFAEENVQAKPTGSSILLNGAKVTLEAYNIKDNNYFKLRDLAKVLNGGSKQFEVTWDASKNAVNILTNHAYTTVGGEQALSADSSMKNAVPSTAKVYIDGTETPLTAYNVNGNNYFKLRDTGDALDFQVAYDEMANTVIINTESILYKNTQYGFGFTLPKSWEGYAIVADQWQGFLMGDQTDVAPEAGPLIKIRNPHWTADKPWQDIPIMVFTPAQWDKVQKEELSVSAAPIPPGELGRSSKYIFALPARYNYAFPEGFEEVQCIIDDKPLQAI